MGANEQCPAGAEIKTAARCREASLLPSSLELNPRRSLQVAYWDWPEVIGVPYQCSTQVGNDDTLHFNTNSGSDNTRFTTGEFVMICEAGKTIFTV